MEGALVSPDIADDWIYENKAFAGLAEHYKICNFPKTYDLRHRSPQPPRNQQARGTCAPHVGSTISEVREFPNIVNYMSPEFIYYHRATKPEAGMYGRDVFRILKTIGSVPEALYPYNTGGAPPEQLYDVASQYRIQNFARVETIVGVKIALLNDEALYLLLPSYSKSNVFWRAPSRDSIPVYHAVTIIGYNKKGFIIRNSWGGDWGDDGYGIFPYCDWPIHKECWVAINDRVVESDTESSSESDVESDSSADPRRVEGCILF